MNKLLYIFLLIASFTITSCNKPVDMGCHGFTALNTFRTNNWILVRLDSNSIMCVPNFPSDSIKPYIIKK